MRSLPVRKLRDDAILPTRAHPDDAGLDLYACEDLELSAGAGGLAATGVAVEIPAGHVGLVCDRSSLARRGLKTAGGVIDAGYRGELGVILWNLAREPQKIARGERIAQLLIVAVATPAVSEAKILTETRRGKKGFGSTGR